MAKAEVSAQGTSAPVQVNSQLTPPNSIYLSDYANASLNKWPITLTLRDFTKSDYRVRLRITIESQTVRLRTKPSFRPTGMYLNAGIPTQVPYDKLGAYLNPNNLEISGINPSTFSNSQQLPEGFYTFTVEVLDYQRGNVVSNLGRSVAWIVQNDPPLLNLPYEDKLRIQEPQQVQFQWTPRHTASPNSAFETEYIFRLWEIWPADRNPNEVVRTSQPIFEHRTNLNSYFYGPGDIALVPGRNYAWQVQAVSNIGRDLFKNEGRSEVKSFQYGDECLPITGFGIEALGPDRIKADWTGGWNHSGYVVKIRESGTTEEWTNYATNIETQVLFDLEADTEYEVQVFSKCGVLTGDGSEVQSVTTFAQDVVDFNCGEEPDNPAITNREPIANLQVGDKIEALGFKVRITELSGSGPYNGKGAIEVPLFNLAGVKADLINIEVNTDKKLIGGFVETTVNPAGPFIVGLGGGDELDEGNADATEDGTEETPDTDVVIDEVITDVEVDEETGEIVVTTEDGETTTIDPDEEGVDENEDGDIVIEDSNGDTWVVGPDGTVSSPNESNDNSSSSGSSDTDTNTDSSTPVIVYNGSDYTDGEMVNFSSDITDLSFELKNFIEGDEIAWSITESENDISSEAAGSNPTDEAILNITLNTDVATAQLNSTFGSNSISLNLQRGAGDSEEDEESGDEAEAELPKIWFNEDNVEYADGEIITIDYTSADHDIAFELKGYPESTESFKWYFMHNGVDHTVDVQNNERNLYNFGMDIGGKAGDIKLIAEYDDQSVEVIINVNRKEFELESIMAVDMKDTKRKAYWGETLYLVSGIGRNVKFQAGIDPESISSSEYNDNDIVWSYNEQETPQQNLEYEFGKRTIIKEYDFSDESLRMNLDAGYPEKMHKYVDVHRIKEDREKGEFLPPGINTAINLSKTVLNEIAENLDNLAGPGVEVEAGFNFSISQEQFNEEIDESRLYRTVREIKASGGANLTAEIMIPGLSFTIPKVLKAGGYVEPYLGIGLGGGIVYYKVVEQDDDFVQSGFDLGLEATGGMSFGAKLEFLPDADNIVADINGYGKVEFTGGGKYQNRTNEPNLFVLELAMNPLIAGVSGELSYKIGETEFHLVDISYEQSLTEKVEFKKDIPLTND